MRVSSAVTFYSSADYLIFPVMCRFWDFNTRFYTREQGAEEAILGLTGTKLQGTGRNA